MKAQTPTQQRLQATVLTEEKDFAALEEEWEDLYEHCPSATPFQSWAWLYSWWEAYGGDYELRLITVRNDAGPLVGLAPLMLDRRWGFGRLLFMGTGITDYLDVLARPEWEDQVTEAIRGTLRQIDGWQVADLQELRPQATTWRLFRSWDRSRTCVHQSDCVEMEVKPWDELLSSSLSKKRRETARRTIRRLESDKVHGEVVGSDNAQRAASRWIELHKQYWQGRDIAPEHLTRRFESHLIAAAHRITVSGVGGIYEFVRDGEVVASDMILVGHDFVVGYLYGANAYARSRFEINTLFVWLYLNVAQDRNIGCVSLSRGAEEYKLKWGSNVVPNHRAILGRNLMILAAYTRYHLLRSKVQAYMLSENAPRWITKIAFRYRGLRLRAAQQVERKSK
jgi:CelD/BcsL family acetyltransferase involved in cellulose biosynthesis